MLQVQIEKIVIMKELIFRNFITLAIFGLMFTSCQKDINNDSADQILESSSAIIDHEMDQASNFSDEAYNSGEIKGDLTSQELDVRHNCATVTIDTLSSPKKITIDFGTVNCLCRDGRNRRGKIITTFEGKYRSVNSTHTITFEGYYVNDNHVEGSRTVVNTGLNQDGKLAFTVVDEGKITLTDGRVFSHSSSRVRTWVEGSNTFLIWDDVYEITGSGSVTNSEGNGFNAVILEPLRISVNCGNISKGILKITPINPDYKERTLDYGDGNCDNLATVTVDGKTRTIILK